MGMKAGQTGISDDNATMNRRKQRLFSPDPVENVFLWLMSMIVVVLFSSTIVIWLVR